ncbi:uncharacterized protein LOC108682413, partial [Hyalella azteca]|uniref:Uncharacterized protein LOC108682413 n=1 Tax=Hyalella azteca TaxID=294128 RepID=A0A8B7PLJ2_HYAAZ
RPGPVLIGVVAHSYTDENSSLASLARCLHAFPQHARDNYNGVFQYTLTGITPPTVLYAVACPLSPYCDVVYQMTMMVPSPDVEVQLAQWDDTWRYMRWLNATQDVRYSRHSDTYYGLL